VSEVQYCSDQFQLGAQQCLKVLRGISLEHDYEDLSLDHIFAWRDATIAKLVATAGVTSDQAAGALSLLAECVVELRTGMSFHEVAGWQPETLLDPQKKEAERRQCLEGD
jgi:hypothetical protein